MRFDKMTLKSQEIIQDSQQLAERLGNQQVEPEHLIRIILEQREGVVPPVLGKIGADRDQRHSGALGGQWNLQCRVR